MNLRILSKHVERAQHMYDNGRDFFPLVKKNRRRRLTWKSTLRERKEVDAPVDGITIFQQSERQKVESHSHPLIFPTLVIYTRHGTTQNGEKYCQGGVEILHCVRTQELLYRTDYNLPLATWLETDDSYCSREKNTSEVTMKSATGEIPPPRLK